MIVYRQITEKQQGTVLQGIFPRKLSYHATWDAASTSQGELSHKLRTMEIQVFACEDDDIPIWCRDQYGTLRPLKGYP
jgi:hypothetical protein